MRRCEFPGFQPLQPRRLAALVDAHVKRERRKVTREFRRRLYHDADWACDHCRAEDLPNDQLTVDHYEPLAHGGKTHDGNCHVLCRPCNVAKGVLPWGLFHNPDEWTVADQRDYDHDVIGFYMRLLYEYCAERRGYP